MLPLLSPWFRSLDGRPGKGHLRSRRSSAALLRGPRTRQGSRCTRAEHTAMLGVTPRRQELGSQVCFEISAVVLSCRHAERFESPPDSHGLFWSCWNGERMSDAQADAVTFPDAVSNRLKTKACPSSGGQPRATPAPGDQRHAAACDYLEIRCFQLQQRWKSVSVGAFYPHSTSIRSTCIIEKLYIFNYCEFPKQERFLCVNVKCNQVVIKILPVLTFPSALKWS